MKEIKFEDAIIKLEGEVKKLESGNMTLDESIAAFEEAVKLIGVCNKQLENAADNSPLAGKRSKSSYKHAE